MTDTEHVIIQEGKKKTGQIITVALFAGLSFIGFAYGAVKLYPITSQLTILLSDVEELKNDVENIKSDLKQEVDNSNEFRLVTFAQRMKEIDEHVFRLDDITGDNDDRVSLLEIAVKQNTDWRQGQVVRVTGRIKDHAQSRRDIDLNTEYRRKQLTDIKDVTLSQLQAEVDALKTVVKVLTDREPQ